MFGVPSGLQFGFTACYGLPLASLLGCRVCHMPFLFGSKLEVLRFRFAIFDLRFATTHSGLRVCHFLLLSGSGFDFLEGLRASHFWFKVYSSFPRPTLLGLTQGLPVLASVSFRSVVLAGFCCALGLRLALVTPCFEVLGLFTSHCCQVEF